LIIIPNRSISCFVACGIVTLTIAIAARYRMPSEYREGQTQHEQANG
jgi:hypothetical protein